MKRLVCEMCGSNELLKQDDRYICQACGTNYTTEEAKKLLIEVSGSVDVSGSTVKVDHTSFVQKSLENARRSKAKEDWAECEKYYNLVEQHDPQNIEAIFYSAYATARNSLIENDRFKREQKFKVLQNSISIIDDNYNPETYDANKEIIEQISSDIISLCSSSFVFNQKQYGYGVVNNAEAAYTYNMFYNVQLVFIESLTNITKIIGENSRDSIYLYRLIINHYQSLLNDVHRGIPAELKNQIRQVNEKIKSIDPSQAFSDSDLALHQNTQNVRTQSTNAFPIIIICIGVFWGIIALIYLLN